MLTLQKAYQELLEKIGRMSKKERKTNKNCLRATGKRPLKVDT